MKELVMSEIDPFKYGQLVAQVEQMEKKIDKLEAGMDELLALANKSKGGFWAGIYTASTGGTLLAWAPLTVSKAINEGDIFRIPASSLSITLS